MLLPKCSEFFPFVRIFARVFPGEFFQNIIHLRAVHALDFILLVLKKFKEKNNNGARFLTIASVWLVCFSCQTCTGQKEGFFASFTTYRAIVSKQFGSPTDVLDEQLPSLCAFPDSFFPSISRPIFFLSGGTQL